jgi:DNA-binding CsgD family transcriptional regulator
MGHEGTEELRGLLAIAANPGAPEDLPPTGLLLPRPSGHRALEALVMPIRVPDRYLGGERTLGALFLSDPEQGMQSPHAVLRRFYGLKPAEAALACELASGHSLREAARHLGVTRGTARQRLQQVFTKTSTCRQASLVRLLLSGPAQLCADD